MVVFKGNVEIKGLGNFEKRITLSKKSKNFKVIYPVKVVQKDIVKTDYDYADSWKEAEDIFDDKVAEFEALQENFELVILYEVEESGSYRDGSGTGFVFNWAIFKKVFDDDRERLHVLRVPKGSKKEEFNISYHYLKDWRRMRWTPEREAFFQKLTDGIATLYFQLEKFTEMVEQSENVPEEFMKFIPFTNQLGDGKAQEDSDARPNT